jgi:8-oxo-dGTP diphosphatase
LSEARFTIAAYAVVENDRGEFLLTRRRESDDWVLPGGSVESEEAPWEAVVREVAEETGLKIALRRLIGVYAKRSEHDLVFLFAASPVGGELATSEERDRVVFLDPHQLPEQTSDRDRERIADAFAGGQTPVLRVQPSEGNEPLTARGKPIGRPTTPLRVSSSCAFAAFDPLSIHRRRRLIVRDEE